MKRVLFTVYRFKALSTACDSELDIWGFGWITLNKQGKVIRFNGAVEFHSFQALHRLQIEKQEKSLPIH